MKPIKIFQKHNNLYTTSLNKKKKLLNILSTLGFNNNYNGLIFIQLPVIITYSSKRHLADCTLYSSIVDNLPPIHQILGIIPDYISSGNVGSSLLDCSQPTGMPVFNHSPQLTIGICNIQCIESCLKPRSANTLPPKHGLNRSCLISEHQT